MSEPKPPSIPFEQTACLLDIVDFIKEKMEEARRDPQSRIGAVSEASGVIPFLCSRLTRDEILLSQAMLLLDGQITDRNWRKWWDDFGKQTDDDFNPGVDDLLSRLDLLKACISQS